MEFAAFADQKTREADAAVLLPLETIETGAPGAGEELVGNAWTRRYYNGDFVLVPAPPKRPAVSLVFVESRDGNTGAARPEDLGGGPTDKHFIYEGLSRVSADAVLSGAASARGKHAFFSVWRTELVALRRELGLSRHPAQIVVSGRGDLNVKTSLLFNVPHVQVIVLCGDECVARNAADFARRSWVSVIPFSGNWMSALSRIHREHGVSRISAIGGRRTATSLIDAGVVQDLCLTKTEIDAGEPGTPFYVGGSMPRTALIVRKRQPLEPNPIAFEHLKF
jgi:riboflavin biosynthesis pyrimidine reductase